MAGFSLTAFVGFGSHARAKPATPVEIRSTSVMGRSGPMLSRGLGARVAGRQPHSQGHE